MYFTLQVSCIKLEWFVSYCIVHILRNSFVGPVFTYMTIIVLCSSLTVSSTRSTLLLFSNDYVNPKVHPCLYKSPTYDPVVNPHNFICNVTTHFPQTHCSNTPFSYRFAKRYLLWGMSTKLLWELMVFLIHAIWPAHHVFLFNDIR